MSEGAAGGAAGALRRGEAPSPATVPGEPEPFPPEEYAGRVERVRGEMARRGVDTLVVTSPPNITYLTGYDSIWYDLDVITAVVLRVGGEPPAFFLDSTYHRELVWLTVTAPEIVFHGGKGLRALVRQIEARGWARGRAGVERWSRSPAWPVLQEMEARLAGAGAEMVDGSWVVDHARLVKSPREIACVRRAAAIADAGMEAVRRELRAGMTETEIAGIAHYAMARLGGEEPAIRTVVRTGPRAGGRHALPTERRVRPGELVDIDFSGSYRRYHANIDRTFALGEPDPRWVDLLARAAGSIEAVVAQVRPGDPARRICEVADAHIDAAGLRRYVRWINGYTLGIGIPADWVGHVFLGGGRFEDAVLEPGFVANYENTFDVVEESWPGGRGAAYIDTLLVTESGIEVLSKLERTLIVA